MKILTIVGARPQFVKASVVSRAIAKESSLYEKVLHTGQHFDANMSDVFFGQLQIPRPDHQLNINGGSHGEMTGRMLAAIENIIIGDKPDRVLVYGDTNSTLAGALAATKLHVPIAHVEAGLRSFNMRMPEEVNRILTDQVSDILFCPTEVAMQNLRDEGFGKKPVEFLNVGDVMLDSARYFSQFARSPNAANLPAEFILATLHRAENTDDDFRLTAIVDALNHVHETAAPVILPLHPRTRAALTRLDVALTVHTIDPVGYLEMIWLLEHCGMVMTDSGGVQKESFFFGKPCVTLREETEWLELVSAGANTLAGAAFESIVDAVNQDFGKRVDDNGELFGDGNASRKIAARLAAGVTL